MSVLKRSFPLRRCSGKLKCDSVWKEKVVASAWHSARCILPLYRHTHRTFVSLYIYVWLFLQWKYTGMRILSLVLWAECYVCVCYWVHSPIWVLYGVHVLQFCIKVVESQSEAWAKTMYRQRVFSCISVAFVCISKSVCAHAYACLYV